MTRAATTLAGCGGNYKHDKHWGKLYTPECQTCARLNHTPRDEKGQPILIYPWDGHGPCPDWTPRDV